MFVFFVGLSLLELEVYGEVIVAVACFALTARIVSWGFEFKIKELVREYSLSIVDMLVTKLFLALPACLLLLIILASNDLGQYAVISILALVFYAFDSLAYHQAREDQGDVVVPVCFGMTSALLVLAALFVLDKVTPEYYFSICVIGPSVGWIYVTLRRVSKEAQLPNIRTIKKLIINGFQMFTVLQIGGLYTSLLPIIIGSHSLVLASVYSIVLRLSNFSKSFGLIVNQVFFYSDRAKSGKINVLLSTGVSLFLALLSGLIVFEMYKQKLSVIIDSQLFFTILVLVFVAVGAVANFLIIKIFFSTGEYLRYRNGAIFIILIPVIWLWYSDVKATYTFIVHLCIELGLIIFALSNYFLKKRREGGTG